MSTSLLSNFSIQEALWDLTSLLDVLASNSTEVDELFAKSNQVNEYLIERLAPLTRELLYGFRYLKWN